MKQILIFVVCLLFLPGCLPPQQVFFWGDYSGTLYAYKKSPSDKTSSEHKKSLLGIIENASKNKMKIPPGIYAELGYVLIKEGKMKEGLAYWDNEVLLFPESIVFINKLKEEIKKGAK
jgi:hypothetical protein